MTDLKLVPPDGPTELERMLLNAAASEKPSLEHKLRVREALGLAIPLGAPPPSSPTAAPPVGVSAGAGKAAAVGISATKALVVGALGTSVVGAALFGLSHRNPAPAPQPAPVHVVATTPAPEPVKAAPAEPAPLAVADLPVAQAEPKKATTGHAREDKASSNDDLQQQIVLIEAARAHVAQQNPWPALQALDTYESKFKGGAFDQEAAVLRMKAVEQTGDHARAASLAKAFLDKNPTSPHVDRVRRIADPAEPR